MPLSSNGALASPVVPASLPVLVGMKMRFTAYLHLELTIGFSLRDGFAGTRVAVLPGQLVACRGERVTVIGPAREESNHVARTGMENSIHSAARDSWDRSRTCLDCGIRQR